VTPFARLVQGVSRAGDPRGPDMARTAVPRLLPGVVTGLAIRQLLLVCGMIEADRTPGVVEDDHSGLLGAQRRHPPHKQKGRQENRAACREQNALTEPVADLHIR